MKRSVVLLGHGSRAPGSDLGLRSAAADLALRTGWNVRIAHMELCEPGLPEVVAGLVEDGATEVLVVPYFLHLGVHLREDIPGIVEGIRASHPGVGIRTTDPLGYDPTYAGILERRVLESGSVA